MPRPTKPNPAQQQKLITDWNASHRVGTEVVRYKLIAPLREPQETKTLSEAWLMGGHTAAIMVEGTSGCVCLESVRPLYDVQGEIPLIGCTAQTEENFQRPANQPPPFVVRAAGFTAPVASDYPYPCEGAGSRLEKAWQILAPHDSGKWKTVTMLRTLRQALRERSAQMMSIDLPPNGASLKAVNHFLATARRYDAAHHGSATF